MKKYIPKILIVDDDQLYLKQFSTILRKEIEAKYYFSDNASGALELINRNSYAIILLDVNIPGKNGFELARDVRSSNFNKHTPIIFITGVSIDDHSVFEGYKAGAVDYLSKPVNKFILFSKIKTFLELDLQKNELLITRDKLNILNESLKEQDDLRTQLLNKEIEKNAIAKAGLQMKSDQLSSKVNQLNCLIDIADYSKKEDKETSDILQKIVDLISGVFTESGSLSVCLVLNGKHYFSKSRLTTKNIIQSKIQLAKNTIGELTIYIDDKKWDEMDKGEKIFLKTIILLITSWIGKLIEQRNTYLNLVENYYFIETLIETMPNPVYYKNSKGEYIGCNKAFEEFQSAKKEDIIGKTIYDFAPKESADKISKLDAEIIKYKEKRITEIKFADFDGTVRNLILYKNQFQVKNSNQPGIIGTVVDVTELTRAKELLKAQHTIDYLSSLEKGRRNIFKNILNSIFEIEWVDSGGIYLMDEEKQDLTLIYHKGLSRKFVNRSKYFPGDSAQVKLVLNKKPFYSRYKELTEMSGEGAQKENLKVLAIIPLIHNQKVIGALNVASKTKDEISETDKTGIESLSSRIGNLIVYAQTQEKLKTYQKELELKIKQRTKGLQGANLKLNKEIEFHKQTKQALVESEYKYRSIFENAQNGIVLYDAETLELVDVNKNAYEDLGYTYKEFKNFKYGDFVIYKDKDERRELIKQLLSKGKFSFQTKHKKKNGEILYRIISASLLNLNNKRYIQGIIHDITELKKKEIELQNSENKFSELQSNIPIGLWIANPDGKFLYANKAAVSMMGYDSEEEMLSIYIKDIYYDVNVRSELVEIFHQKGFLNNAEVQFVRKDKSVFWGSVSLKAVIDNGGNLIRLDGITQDISERKEVQLKLEKAHEEIKLINQNLEKKIKNALKEEKQQQQYMIQKSKIESLGELAAGIAHEINQPLGVMSLSLENLQMKISSNKYTPEYLHDKFTSIEYNIGRIRQIVDHIRTFSRDTDSVAIEKVNVNKGIANALLLIGTQYINHNIKINLELQENIGFSIGSKLKFEQVILNLLSNAKYAVDERAINYSESEYTKVIKIKTIATEKKIAILVEDNGTGIKSEYITKVFEPFFTSKPEGIGTGLGLSIVYGIIKEMRGDIILDSKRNKYTKVKISLPRFPEND